MKHLFIIFSLLLTSVSWSEDVDWKEFPYNRVVWDRSYVVNDLVFKNNQEALKLIKKYK